MTLNRFSRWGVVAAVVLGATLPAMAEETTFRIVSGRSEVAFDATYPLGDFTGTTKDVKGEIRLDPADLARPVVAQVEVDPSSLNTGISGRDRDLRDTMEVERFPSIHFVVREVRAARPSLLGEPEVPVVIAGRMTIHGVERPAEFSGKARLQDAVLRVEGATALKMTDYGIKPPSKFFFRVGDEIKIRFSSEAVRK